MGHNQHKKEWTRPKITTYSKLESYPDSHHDTETKFNGRVAYHKDVLFENRWGLKYSRSKQKVIERGNLSPQLGPYDTNWDNISNAKHLPPEEMKDTIGGEGNTSPTNCLSMTEP